jgi:hypothetical protein
MLRRVQKTRSLAELGSDQDVIKELTVGIQEILVVQLVVVLSFQRILLVPAG